MKKLYLIGAICIITFAVFVAPTKSQAAQTLSLLTPGPFKTTDLIPVLRNFNNQAPDPCVVVPSIKKPDGSLIAMKRIGPCVSGDFHFDIIINNTNSAISSYFTLASSSMLSTANSLIASSSKLTFVIGTLTIDVPMTATASLTLSISSVTSNSIELNWTSTYTTPLTKLYIDRATSTGAFTNIRAIDLTTNTAPYFFLDSNLAASTTYSYRVQGMLSDVTATPNSNVVSTTTKSDTNKLTGSMILNENQQGVKLEWTNDPALAGLVDSIYIERSVDGGTKFRILTTVTPNTTSYFDDLNNAQLDSNEEIYRIRTQLISTPIAKGSIKNIASAVLALDGGSPTSNTVTVKNCVKIGGDGLGKKIVFRKGDLWLFSFKGLLNAAKSTSNAFLSTEPFKSYSSDFSFYIDMKRVKESALTKSPDLFYYDQASESTILTSSSCGSDVFETTFFSSMYSDLREMVRNGDTGAISGMYSFFRNPLVYLSPNSPVVTNPELFSGPSLALNTVFVHEIGHAIGGLNDEYGKSLTAPWPSNLIMTNCTQSPSNQYKSTITGTAVIYGSLNAETCNFTADENGYKYYKPSSQSIMNMDSTNFNIISCGYLIAGIKGELPKGGTSAILKAAAEKYWPTCAAMEGINKDGYTTATPTVSSLKTASDTGPRYYKINGVKFSLTSNNVKLVPAIVVTNNSSNLANGISSISEKIWNFFSSVFSPQPAAVATTKQKIKKPVVTASTTTTTSGRSPYYTTAGGPYTVAPNVPVTFSGTAVNASDPSEVVAVTWTFTGSPTCTNIKTPTPTCTYKTLGKYAASVSPDKWTDFSSQANVTVTTPDIIIAATSTGSVINLVIPDSVPMGNYNAYVSSAGSPYVLAGTVSLITPRIAPVLTGNYTAANRKVNLNWINASPGKEIRLYYSLDNSFWSSLTNITSTTTSSYSYQYLTSRTVYYKARNVYQDAVNGTTYSEYTPSISVVIP